MARFKFSSTVINFLIAVAVLSVLTHSVLTASEVEKSNSTEVENNSTASINNSNIENPEGIFDKFQKTIVDILKNGFNAIKHTAAKVLNSVAKAVKSIGEDDKHEHNSTLSESNSTNSRSQRHSAKSSSIEEFIDDK